MNTDNQNNCPAENAIKLLSGKWKPQIFKLAVEQPIRFNALLRALPGASKQAIATALKELEEAEILDKIKINEKPLHIEYHLTEKGKSIVPVFQQLETIFTTTTESN